MSSETRRRYQGTPQELAAILAPFVTSIVFLKYDECKRSQKARVDKQEIQRQAPLLGALHDANPNLSFTKVVSEKAFRQVYTEKSLGDSHHEDDWSSTMSLRLRNMCRAVMQACRGGRTPQWAECLPWVGVAESPGAGGESRSRKRSRKSESRETKKEDVERGGSGTEASGPDECVWFYGWSDEAKKAWRQDEAKRKFEWSLGLQEPPDCSEHDAMIAKFRDGTKHPVAERTVSQHRAASEAARAKGNKVSGVLWEGEHMMTHNKLCIKMKPDRAWLCVLEEQGKQVCGMRISILGGEETKHFDEAQQYMVTLAER